MAGPIIRPYVPGDREAVRTLFIAVNRDLAPPGMRDVFEQYIVRSLADEIDRIEAYYQAHGGCFMVATTDGRLAGMFGLERAGPDAMELRRMYVAPDRRRAGIARLMLSQAEALARSLGAKALVLSTSELQPAALALYRASGFTETRVEIAAEATHKTVGAGIRRYHFEKPLS